MNIENIGQLITEQALNQPKKTSIKRAKRTWSGGHKYPSYNFETLEKRINQFANKLVELGVKPQDKVLFFVKPELDFSAITYALFRLGAIIIFIDPGMKREYFFNAIKEVKPNVLIGMPRVHYMRHFFRDVFQSVNLFITTSKLSGLYAKSLYRRLKKQSKSYEIYRPRPCELAAILYTSGGTGAPKGVEYTHEIFIHQTQMLKNEFDLNPMDIDIPCFPLFSFFTLAMGMTSVIPDMDASRPIKVRPERLYKNIIDTKATFLAGSPAIWKILADYCLENELTMDSVKYLVMFGAPVRIDLHKKLKKILPNGTSYTPYGATECLPVSNISGQELIKSHEDQILNGAGTCIGKPLAGVKVKIIQRTEGAIKNLSLAKELGPGEIGEIIISSPHVTQKYHLNKIATKEAKIYEAQQVWHRMGDVGYLDEVGKLWFCGRSNHVVSVKGESFYPNQIETIFNTHSQVARSALIKVHKSNQAAVVIERKDKRKKIDAMFLMDLKNLAQSHEKTKKIHKFYGHSHFPLDIRHNIKIDRTRIEQEINNE